MGRIVPVRFKRVAEAFNDMATLRRGCDSSGSEHSPETMNLSDLVDSYIENEIRGNITRKNREICEIEEDNEYDESENVSDSSDVKETLQELFSCDDNNGLKGNLVLAIQEAVRLIGKVGFGGFKRRLMAILREKGFDVGLCKSKWDKNGHIPSGSYDYIDVNISGDRYVIEVNLAAHFDIAQPTNTYSSLLQTLPSIFVAKLEDLKRVVRLMCTAIRRSMKKADMPLPPWRRYGYMQAKWFGSYKRKTNETARKMDDDVASKRTVGFAPLPTISFYCRDDIATNVGFRIEKLAMEMNGNGYYG